MCVSDILRACPYISENDPVAESGGEVKTLLDGTRVYEVSVRVNVKQDAAEAVKWILVSVPGAEMISLPRAVHRQDRTYFEFEVKVRIKEDAYGDRHE